jgi:hypothetical protein
MLHRPFGPSQNIVGRASHRDPAETFEGPDRKNVCLRRDTRELGVGSDNSGDFGAMNDSGGLGAMRGLCNILAVNGVVTLGDRARDLGLGRIDPGIDHGDERISAVRNHVGFGHMHFGTGILVPR